MCFECLRERSFITLTQEGIVMGTWLKDVKVPLGGGGVRGSGVWGLGFGSFWGLGDRRFGGLGGLGVWVVGWLGREGSSKILLDSTRIDKIKLIYIKVGVGRGRVRGWGVEGLHLVNWTLSKGISYHSPMWKTRGPLTTIANNFFLRHWWLVCCSDQSQL